MDGNWGVVFRKIPHSLNSSHSRLGSKRLGTLVQPPWCQAPSGAQDGAFWAANQAAEKLSHHDFHCGEGSPKINLLLITLGGQHKAVG